MLRTGENIRVHFEERFPEWLIVFLILHALAVRAASHDDGNFGFGVRAIHIRPQNDAVIHFDG